MLAEDARAVRRNDPAARSALETLLCHTPLHAIFVYRLAHRLHPSVSVALANQTPPRAARG